MNKVNMKIFSLFSIGFHVLLFNRALSDVNNNNEQKAVYQNEFDELVLDSYEDRKFSSHVTVSVNSDIETGKLKHFWKSTGFCPPDPHNESSKFFLSNDVHQSITYMGSLPHHGITHVRIHWLLELVGMKVNNSGLITYDISYLDQLINRLWENELMPTFELMGNPSQIFHDFENATQVCWWRDLVKHLAQHYIDLYGIQYVRKWYFETWNEPDHHDFDGLNFTVQGFLNYYDACSEGLSSANKYLKLGGPGGSCHIPGSGKSPICWALLEHSSSGKNFFTGKHVTLDFISFHKKGNRTSQWILQQEKETIRYIKTQYPSLSHLPFFNDEADPLKNWSLDQWWRADATYAALVVKIIIQHIRHYFYNRNPEEIDYVNFDLLSNDNAFMSYFPYQFTQRTLLARFQINNTVPKQVQFIHKPVYTVMGLLSQLCNKLVEVKTFGNLNENSLDVTATVCDFDSFDLQVLISNSDDTGNRSVATLAHIYVYTSLPTVSSIKLAVYQVDNIRTNPYLVWKNIVRNPYPSLLQLAEMKKQEGPFLQYIHDINVPPPWNFNITVRMPGVTLLNICAKRTPPSAVNHVRVLGVSEASLLISWSDTKNRCILTYNIYHSVTELGPFRQLNQKFLKYCSFWFPCSKLKLKCDFSGYYRIEAVDFWEQKSVWSKPIKFEPFSTGK